ncbi:hypothetical protein Tco_1378094 [Tanacetum coccineum]
MSLSTKALLPRLSKTWQSFKHPKNSSILSKSDRDFVLIYEDDDDEEIKWVDLTELVKETGAEGMDLDSPKDDQPLQISNDDEADIQAEVQLTELLESSLKLELDKMLKDYDFSTSLPSDLKELPTKVDKINGSLSQLKRYVETLEIEVPGDMNELPAKLHKFQSFISALTTKVASLEGFKLDIPAGLLTLHGFAKAISLASQKASDKSVPSACQDGTHPAEGEKNTRQSTIT